MMEAAPCISCRVGTVYAHKKTPTRLDKCVMHYATRTTIYDDDGGATPCYRMKYKKKNACKMCLHVDKANDIAAQH